MFNKYLLNDLAFYIIITCNFKAKGQYKKLLKGEVYVSMLSKVTGLLYDLCFILPFTFFLYYRTTLLVKT